jgi:hypothetical protein
MSMRRWLALVAAVVGWPLLATSPASAAEPGRAAGIASFGGMVIDLAEGWQGAQSCVVFSRTEVRCYSSYAEADASLGYSPKDPPVAVAPLAAPSCASGWLCLYADVDGQGRRLQFRDEFWNYLSAYGFERQTSSWRNNQGGSDGGYLSLHNLSSAYVCGANSYVLRMGTYDNQAYAVWG